ncbi:hypothetical protein DIPPA_50241, partial [Diplonema papillatum]
MGRVRAGAKKSGAKDAKAKAKPRATRRKARSESPAASDGECFDDGSAGTNPPPSPRPEHVSPSPGLPDTPLMTSKKPAGRGKAASTPGLEHSSKRRRLVYPDSGSEDTVPQAAHDAPQPKAEPVSAAASADLDPQEHATPPILSVHPELQQQQQEQQQQQQQQQQHQQQQQQQQQ